MPETTGWDALICIAALAAACFAFWVMFRD